MKSDNAITAYSQNRVLTTNPMGLVRLLYEEAIRQVEKAGQCLASGAPQARAKSVSKAVAILGELVIGLNHDAAPEMSERLKQFYDYLQWRLLAGHAQRDATAFAEVLSLLKSMAEAWETVQAKLGQSQDEAQPAAKLRPPANPYGQAAAKSSAPKYL